MDHGVTKETTDVFFMSTMPVVVTREMDRAIGLTEIFEDSEEFEEFYMCNNGKGCPS